MKKKFWVGVSVIIMLCMFLVACSETIANSGDENTTEVTQETTEETTEAETIDEEVTTSETTENTSLGIGEQSLESYEHDLVFLSVYNSRWILGDFINAILHERIWIADYQEKFGMTFDKVYKERCELGWIMPPNEFLELPEADAVRAFYESLSLAWDIPNKFSFSGENWEEWWDDFESSEISLELDIRALKHFNITREEFERANDREIWVRLRLFERGLDIESIKSVRTFTPEEIDIIFS
ncbi:MAG: hypothetical protein FWG45_01245, partial [Oscillospiraceae bacterium]|nr:hypothetical protein [Oscillospiraceae bacterium]